MSSIKLNDFKFSVYDNEVTIYQHDKSMGMYEVLKRYQVSDLVNINDDFTITTYKTVVIPKHIMQHLTAFIKSKEGSK